MRRPTRPSAALVIASLALAAAMAPPAYSALAPKLAKNTVGSPQIKDKSIQATDLDHNVVTTSKIGPARSAAATWPPGRSTSPGSPTAPSVASSWRATASTRQDRRRQRGAGRSHLAGAVGRLDVPADHRVPVAADAAVALGSLSGNGGGALSLDAGLPPDDHRTGLRAGDGDRRHAVQGPARLQPDRRRHQPHARVSAADRAGRRDHRPRRGHRAGRGRQPRRRPRAAATRPTRRSR